MVRTKPHLRTVTRRERELERGACCTSWPSTLDSPTSSACRRHMPPLFARKHSDAASLCRHCCSLASRGGCVRLEDAAAEAARNCQRVKVDVAARARTAHRPPDEASQRKDGIAGNPHNDMHGSERTSRIQHTHEGGHFEAPAQKASDGILAAPSRTAVESSPFTSATADVDLCMDAFRVVLNDHSNDGKQWFVSTVNLSMVSLEFCVACRTSRNYHIRVPWGTPRWMWGPALSHRASHVLARCTRSSRSSITSIATRHIPDLQVRGMTWGLSTTTTVFLEENKLISGLETLVFGDHFNDDISDVVWPQGLKRLAFGRGFNQGIARVVYPASLQELSFGTWFNRSLDGATWPECLCSLSFGDLFNKPIEDVVFPASLQQLSLGFCFDRPIARVRWPASLEKLSFGHNFSQPIHRVTWPESLRVLRFGHCFNQSIAGVVWPASLQQLSFGWKFDHPIDCVAWPESLTVLTFGYSFNQDLQRVRWPTSLKQLALADTFARPLQGVRWPPDLEEIRLGFRLDCSLRGVDWPHGLKRLMVRDGVVDLTGLVLPPGTTTTTFR